MNNNILRSSAKWIVWYWQLVTSDWSVVSSIQRKSYFSFKEPLKKDQDLWACNDVFCLEMQTLKGPASEMGCQL